MNEELMKELLERYEKLFNCKEDINLMAIAIDDTIKKGGKILICGNGGSSADAMHIVGELMKEFYKKRMLDEEFLTKLKNKYPEENYSDNLQQPIPAIALGTNPAFVTAYSNDVDPDMIFAQELFGIGKKNDLLLGLSTSGSSKNVINAIKIAKVMGITTASIGSGGELSNLCDNYILLPEKETYKIQELTIPIYHALCRNTELMFIKKGGDTF